MGARSVLAYDVNGKLVHISEVNKDTRDSVKYICPRCKKEFIACMGEKNSDYFRHKVVAECSGNATESELHKLAKQLISESTSFRIPDYTVTLGGNIKPRTYAGRLVSYSNDCVKVEEDFGGFRPDATIHLSADFYVFVEIYYRHKVSQSKISKMEAFDKPYVTVEINIDGWIDCLTDKDFLEKFKHFLTLEESTDERNVVSSTVLAKIHKNSSDVEHFFGDYEHICPVIKSHYSGSAVVDTSICKKCSCFGGKLKTGGYHCFGIKAISSVADLEKGTDVDTCMDKLDSTIFANRLPKPILGVCKKCGRPMLLANGCATTTQYPIPSVTQLLPEMIGGINSKYACAYCPNCGYTYELHSKEGSRYIIVVNKAENNGYGTVALITNDIKSYVSDSDNKRLNSLAIFRSFGTNIYDGGIKFADELIAVGSILDYLNRDEDALTKLYMTSAHNMSHEFARAEAKRMIKLCEDIKEKKLTETKEENQS